MTAEPIRISPPTSRRGIEQFVTRAPTTGRQTCPPCVWPANMQVVPERRGLRAPSPASASRRSRTGRSGAAPPGGRATGCARRRARAAPHPSRRSRSPAGSSSGRPSRRRAAGRSGRAARPPSAPPALPVPAEVREVVERPGHEVVVRPEHEPARQPAAGRADRLDRGLDRLGLGEEVAGDDRDVGLRQPREEPRASRRRRGRRGGRTGGARPAGPVRRVGGWRGRRCGAGTSGARSRSRRRRRPPRQTATTTSAGSTGRESRGGRVAEGAGARADHGRDEGRRQGDGRHAPDAVRRDHEPREGRRSRAQRRRGPRGRRQGGQEARRVDRGVRGRRPDRARREGRGRARRARALRAGAARRRSGRRADRRGLRRDGRERRPRTWARSWASSWARPRVRWTAASSSRRSRSGWASARR